MLLLLLLNDRFRILRGNVGQLLLDRLLIMLLWLTGYIRQLLLLLLLLLIMLWRLEALLRIRYMFRLIYRVVCHLDCLNGLLHLQLVLLNRHSLLHHVLLLLLLTQIQSDQCHSSGGEAEKETKKKAESYHLLR